MRKSLHVFIVLLLGVLTSHCARKSSEGGQDGGGALTLQSTRQQVQDAIDVSLALLTNPDTKSNLMVAFWEEKGLPGLDDADYDFHSNLYIFPKYYSAPTHSNPGRDYSSPALRALRDNTKIYTDGDCPEREHKHADASVSTFDVHGTICISVGHLMHIDPHHLLGDVVSLLAHETVHLGGGDEREALHVQKEMADYYAARFGELSPAAIRDQTTEGLVSLLKNTLSGSGQLTFGRARPTRTSMLISLGSVLNTILSLPFGDDAVALQIAFNVKDPALVENYLRVRDALIQHISKIVFHGVRSINIANAAPTISDEALDALFSDLAKMSLVLDKNFTALAMPERQIQTECIHDWQFRINDDSDLGPYPSTSNEPIKCSGSDGWPKGFGD